MTLQNEFILQASHGISLTKRMLHGGGIAFLLIFLRVGDLDASWSKLFMLKPLIIVLPAGLLGGLFYFLIDNFGFQNGWRRLLVKILSVVVYVIGLPALGTILDLDGNVVELNLEFN